MKRTKIVLALLLLAVMLTSSFALVACDKTPEKYKMKNFYGTYDQFANDYLLVYFFSMMSIMSINCQQDCGIYVNSKRIRSSILTFRVRRKSKSAMLL